MRHPAADPLLLRAPRSHFRVVAVDLQDAAGAVYAVGDFTTLDAAQSAASQRAGIGSPVFIYDDACKLLERFGSWH
ncbi:MAG: hypothetical protein ACXVZR_05055 [Terriglobales bacterium]